MRKGQSERLFSSIASVPDIVCRSILDWLARQLLNFAKDRIVKALKNRATTLELHSYRLQEEPLFVPELIGFVPTCSFGGAAPVFHIQPTKPMPVAYDVKYKYNRRRNKLKVSVSRIVLNKPASYGPPFW